MQGFHKKYTLHCEALSPIHIGSGEALSRWEYIVIGNKLYYTTDEFWKCLHENSTKDFTNELLRKINSSDSSISLTSIFNTLPNKEQLEKTLELSKIEFSPLKRGNKPIIRNINRFAGVQNYYIPGSSIKGAFRGAYEIQRIDKLFFQEPSKEEQYFLDSLSDKDQQELHQNISDTFKEYSKVNSEISQIFQGIRIKDISIREDNLVTIPITFAKKEKDKEAAELYECLKARNRFKIEITYKTEDPDSKIFKTKFLDPIFNFYADSFQELSSSGILTEYYEDAENRKREREKETGKKVSFFRCGYGSGQVCNSILGLWKKYSNTGNDQILWQGKSKDLLKKGEFKNIEDYYYPSAPKRDISNLEEQQPLGWIMIDSIECRN